MKYKINILSIYEKGHYRDTQEDNIYPPYQSATAEDRLFMVCDGMGGHEAGEVASKAVCEAMSRVILELAPGEEVLTNEIIGQALTEAYDLLDERDPNPESMKKMGTTMTLLKLHAKGATIAHIGDSRVYQLRPDKEGKMQVAHKTRDHSLVNDLLKVGELKPEEVESFPRKNVITRAMQSHMERRPKADVTQIEDVRAGDYFLLCSDGILEHTSDENLCYMIGMPEADDAKKAKMLLETTENNKDNHSAYLIHILEAEETAQANPDKTREVQEPSPSESPAARQAGKNGSIIRYLAMGISSLLVIGGAWLYTTTHKKPDSAKQPNKEEPADTIQSTPEAEAVSDADIRNERSREVIKTQP